MPFPESGDATLRDVVSLPDECFAPIVFLTGSVDPQGESPGKFFAVAHLAQIRRRERCGSEQKVRVIVDEARNDASALQIDDTRASIGQLPDRTCIDSADSRSGNAYCARDACARNAGPDAAVDVRRIQSWRRRRQQQIGSEHSRSACADELPSVGTRTGAATSWPTGC